MGKVSSATFLATLILFILSIAPARGQSVGARPLTNKEITGMVRAGVPSSNIVTAIRTSQCDFDTDPLVLISLKQKGVSDDVLLAMVNAPHGKSGGAVAESEGRFEVGVSVVSLMPVSGRLASSMARRATKDADVWELVSLRRVFVTSPDPAAGRAVAGILGDYAGLEIVRSAKEAEFVLAYSIVAPKSKGLRQSRRAQAQMSAYALAPGGQRRRLWHETAAYQPGHAAISDKPSAALALNFVNALKAARGEVD